MRYKTSVLLLIICFLGCFWSAGVLAEYPHNSRDASDDTISLIAQYKSAPSEEDLPFVQWDHITLTAQNLPPNATFIIDLEISLLNKSQYFADEWKEEWVQYLRYSKLDPNHSPTCVSDNGQARLYVPHPHRVANTTTQQSQSNETLVPNEVFLLTRSSGSSNRLNQVQCTIPFNAWQILRSAFLDHDIHTIPLPLGEALTITVLLQQVDIDPTYHISSSSSSSSSSSLALSPPNVAVTTPSILLASASATTTGRVINYQGPTFWRTSPLWDAVSENISPQAHMLTFSHRIQGFLRVQNDEQCIFSLLQIEGLALSEFDKIASISVQYGYYPDISSTSQLEWDNATQHFSDFAEIQFSLPAFANAQRASFAFCVLNLTFSLPATRISPFVLHYRFNQLRGVFNQIPELEFVPDSGYFQHINNTNLTWTMSVRPNRDSLSPIMLNVVEKNPEISWFYSQFVLVPNFIGFDPRSEQDFNTYCRVNSVIDTRTNDTIDPNVIIPIPRKVDPSTVPYSADFATGDLYFIFFQTYWNLTTVANISCWNPLNAQEKPALTESSLSMHMYDRLSPPQTPYYLDTFSFAQLPPGASWNQPQMFNSSIVIEVVAHKGLEPDGVADSRQVTFNLLQRLTLPPNTTTMDTLQGNIFSDLDFTSLQFQAISNDERLSWYDLPNGFKIQDQASIATTVISPFPGNDIMYNDIKRGAKFSWVIPRSAFNLTDDELRVVEQYVWPKGWQFGSDQYRIVAVRLDVNETAPVIAGKTTFNSRMRCPMPSTSSSVVPGCPLLIQQKCSSSMQCFPDQGDLDINLCVKGSCIPRYEGKTADQLLFSTHQRALFDQQQRLYPYFDNFNERHALAVSVLPYILSPSQKEVFSLEIAGNYSCNYGSCNTRLTRSYPILYLEYNTQVFKSCLDGSLQIYADVQMWRESTNTLIYSNFSVPLAHNNTSNWRLPARHVVFSEWLETVDLVFYTIKLYYTTKDEGCVNKPSTNDEILIHFGASTVRSIAPLPTSALSPLLESWQQLYIGRFSSATDLLPNRPSRSLTTSNQHLSRLQQTLLPSGITSYPIPLENELGFHFIFEMNNFSPIQQIILTPLGTLQVFPRIMFEHPLSCAIFGEDLRVSLPERNVDSNVWFYRASIPFDPENESRFLPSSYLCHLKCTFQISPQDYFNTVQSLLSVQNLGLLLTLTTETSNVSLCTTPQSIERPLHTVSLMQNSVAPSPDISAQFASPRSIGKLFSSHTARFVKTPIRAAYQSMYSATWQYTDLNHFTQGRPITPFSPRSLNIEIQGPDSQSFLFGSYAIFCRKSTESIFHPILLGELVANQSSMHLISQESTLPSNKLYRVVLSNEIEAHPTPNTVGIACVDLQFQLNVLIEREDNFHDINLEKVPLSVLLISIKQVQSATGQQEEDWHSTSLNFSQIHHHHHHPADSSSHLITPMLTETTSASLTQPTTTFIPIQQLVPGLASSDRSYQVYDTSQFDVSPRRVAAANCPAALHTRQDHECFTFRAMIDTGRALNVVGIHIISPLYHFVSALAATNDPDFGHPVDGELNNVQCNVTAENRPIFAPEYTSHSPSGQLGYSNTLIANFSNYHSFFLSLPTFFHEFPARLTIDCPNLYVVRHNITLPSTILMNPKESIVIAVETSTKSTALFVSFFFPPNILANRFLVHVVLVALVVFSLLIPLLYFILYQIVRTGTFSSVLQTRRAVRWLYFIGIVSPLLQRAMYRPVANDVPLNNDNFYQSPPMPGYPQPRPKGSQPETPYDQLVPGQTIN